MLSSLRLVIVLPMLLLLAACGGRQAMNEQAAEPEHPNSAIGIPEETITVTSSAFEEGGDIPQKFTCDGENIHPPLTLSGVPEDAESLAVIVDDPDAPMGTFDHWVLWNIPPNLKTIDAAGEPPESVVFGENSKGEKTYTGPCPPEGQHRYYFKVYALNKMLDLPSGASKEQLETEMVNHIVARGQLMGRYTADQQQQAAGNN